VTPKLGIHSRCS